MTRYEFMEKIGFFMVGKEGHQWQGRLKKKEQIAAFGLYLGKGLLKVCETTMTIVMEVRICFGSEGEIQSSACPAGVVIKEVFTPLEGIPSSV